MKTFFGRNTKKLVGIALALLMIVTAASPVFASSPFDDGAYASVFTASDTQGWTLDAYERFDSIVSAIKESGQETPHSLIIGGDYTRLLFDYAVPGISLIRKGMTDAYADFDPDNVVCIQGNHDNVSSGFTKTGFYDMGLYNLYVINEDDFPWLETLRPLAVTRVKKVAQDMKKSFDSVIAKGDMRPVIVVTHLPLHHMSRTLWGDNRFAGYLFDVINEAAEKLDVIFLFGHQHSGDYDDYIGGSVNFMAPGDTIRVPKKDSIGENAYTEETLNFTYTNCGYIGYAKNGVSDTSTNVLTAGVIRFSDSSFRFLKYTEDGLLMQKGRRA